MNGLEKKRQEDMKKFKSLAYWLVACKYLPSSIKVTLKSWRAVERWHSQLKWYLIQSVFSIRNLNNNYFCTSKENYGANPRSLALQLLHLLICLDAFPHQTARWLMKCRTLYARNLWQTSLFTFFDRFSRCRAQQFLLLYAPMLDFSHQTRSDKISRSVPFEPVWCRSNRV